MSQLDEEDRDGLRRRERRWETEHDMPGRQLWPAQEMSALKFQRQKVLGWDKAP